MTVNEIVDLLVGTRFTNHQKASQIFRAEWLIRNHCNLPDEEVFQDGLMYICAEVTIALLNNKITTGEWTIGENGVAEIPMTYSTQKEKSVSIGSISVRYDDAYSASPGFGSPDEVKSIIDLFITQLERYKQAG